MSVPAAFIGMIIIWSTTPLAIKWSGEDVGFLFGITSRMLLSAMISTMIMLALVRKLPWHRKAIYTYLAGCLGIFGSMMCVYWGSQFITSGLVAVIFGLTPIVTGVLAGIFLGERAFTSGKLTGVVLGITGLVVVFANKINFGEHAGLGILGCLLAVLIHSISGVWIKSINAQLPALEVTNGSLLFAAPCYMVSWVLFGGVMPVEVHTRALSSILYLSLFGSVLGFIMYFYVLKHIEASKAALVTLITPVIALILGYFFNQEVLDPIIWVGAVCILSGMFAYQWGDKLGRKYVKT
ncbi:MAG: DMT family transporter [Gammaproteobacteria bacterium]|nr:DMT family transporter [Gammaproteobacteria bacterium]